MFSKIFYTFKLPLFSLEKFPKIKESKIFNKISPKWSKKVTVKNYLVCYDIANPKRLPKISKKAYAYAIGGQKSAIEAPLSKTDALHFIDELKRIIKPKEDKINIIEIEDDPILLGRAFRLLFDESGSIVL